jgi:hypothetical protein
LTSESTILTNRPNYFPIKELESGQETRMLSLLKQFKAELIKHEEIRGQGKHVCFLNSPLEPGHPGLCARASYPCLKERTYIWYWVVTARLSL